MDIIGKAFNPAGGTERAVCTNIDGWISGLMVKGEDDGLWGHCLHKNTGTSIIHSR